MKKVTNHKPGHVTYYFKDNKMPFIILKTNHENVKPLKNADDSKKNAFFLNKFIKN
jgi:hypothetical protein